jgi:hypothetical protein
MLNHVPVLGAFLIIGSILFVIYKKDRKLTLLCLQFIVLIGLLTLPAYFTGEPSEEMVEHLPGVSETLINKHENIAMYALLAMEVMTALSLFGLFVSRHGAKIPTRLLGGLFLISLLNMVMMTWTANLGGQIRHVEIRSSSVSQGSGILNSEHQNSNDD